MMKKLAVLLMVAGLATTTGIAAAQAMPDGADLARTKNCIACHAVGSKRIGPSFRDIAKKYDGQKGAEDLLVQKVRNGGSGVWGVLAMPANAQVSDAEAHALVRWALMQK